MNQPNRNHRSPPEDETSSPFVKRWRRRQARLGAVDLRERWWRLLNRFESNLGLRLALYAVATGVVVAVASWFWVYPWWSRHNALRMTRQWIAAGRLENAGDTLKQALADSPKDPEVLRLAAEVARRRGTPAVAMEYSRQAALLAFGNTEIALEWASDALLAAQPDEAERVLSGLPVAVVAGSGTAQRLAGEIARRRVQLTAARDRFEAALRLDGPVALDEVPLGSILVFAREPAERARGLALLTKWAGDPAWGASALRTLLGDALDHNDRPAMLKWGEALREHPRCTLSDIPNCLLALALADEARFGDVLALLEKKQSEDQGQVAQLAGWLNQIGRSREAIQWLRRLPPALTAKPPVAPGEAEALRLTSDWPALAAWVRDADWGRDLDFLRRTYLMLAARKLGNKSEADDLWRSLQGEAQREGVHALFAADTIYAWGWRDEAIALMWLAAEKADVMIEALGALARHYQVERDAAGQLRVFRRLHDLRARDVSITNNFAFFEALAGTNLAAAETAARENHDRDPANRAFLATYAFVVFQEKRPVETIALLKPVAGEWQKSPGLAFVYGLALAATGRQEEARPLLASLELGTMTTREEELVRAALN